MKMRLLSLLLLVGLVIFAATTTEHANNEVQTQAGKPEEVETELIKDLSGVARSVIGHYDVGLDQASSRVPARVAETLPKFILKDPKLFGLLPDDKLRLVVNSIDELDKRTVVAQVDQYVGNLRVLDSDLTAIFAEDGFLQSLNGGIVPNRIPEARPSLSLARILEVLKQDSKAKAMGDLDGFQEAGNNISRRADGAIIEAGWSRHQQGPTWRASLPEEIIWIDDKTGAVVRRQSQRNHGPTTTCSVRHRNWPRATDGRATSLAETTSANMVTSITCEADQVWNTCYWKLKREPFLWRHGIARIDDVNGGEQEDAQSCASSTAPTFLGSNGDGLREQGAFYIANQMRFFINQNVWAQVSPNRDQNLDIHVDDNGVVDDDGDPSAYFNDFWQSIRSHQSRSQQETLMHEYGHYVVWTYDDVSNECEQGSDEGDALDETLANVFAGVYARDSRDIDPKYGAYSGLAGAPSPHTGDSSLLLQDVNCSSGDDPHGLGEAFEQAVWELLFNRNCTIDNCTSLSENGDRIWPGSGRDEVVRHVGASLGFALRALGANITHSQVAAQMIVKIRRDSGTQAGNRARAVFVHHGVL